MKVGRHQVKRIDKEGRANILWQPQLRKVKELLSEWLTIRTKQSAHVLSRSIEAATVMAPAPRGGGINDSRHWHQQPVAGLISSVAGSLLAPVYSIRIRRMKWQKLALGAAGAAKFVVAKTMTLCNRWQRQKQRQ